MVQLGMWLVIHTEIKGKPSWKKGPQMTFPILNAICICRQVVSSAEQIYKHMRVKKMNAEHMIK